MLLDNIKLLLESTDDAYWEALASRGLLRRAQKDLANRVQVVLHGEEAGRIALTVSGFKVKIPSEGPARATCTCPAPGVCQHIIIACLFLKAAPAADSPGPEGAREAADPGRARKELLAITVDELKRWAGAAAFRAGVRLLQAQPDIVIEERDAITVRFTGLAAHCVYSPGAGLNGIVVTAPASRARRLAVAAVLAFQRHCGLAFAEDQELAQIGVPPRTRDQILGASLGLFQEMVTVGLSHVTQSSAERLSTLSLSALAVNLPRLSLALRDASDHVNMIVKRRAQADEARLLALLSRTFALAEAIRNSLPEPRPDLVGHRRTEYYDVASLDLCGVAAYPWRTGSGYQGLTVLFWQNSTERWFSWSDSRPETNQGSFDPVSRYDSEGPWVGARSPRQASRSNLVLTRARVNGFGRLSSTTACRAGVLGPSPLAHLDFGERLFTQTSDLIEYVAGCRGIGLRDPNPHDSLLVFQPAEWGPRAFDEINQRFVWVVADETGRRIALELPYDPLHAAAIRWLESAGSLSGSRVLARAIGPLTRLSLYPISILGSDYGENGIFHLALDSIQQQGMTAPLGQAQPSAVARVQPGQSGQSHPQDQRAEPGHDGAAWDGAGNGAVSESADASHAAAVSEGDEPDYEAEHHKGVGPTFEFADPILATLEEALQMLAESGTGGLDGPCRDRLRALSDELATRGLILLARHTATLAACSGGFDGDSGSFDGSGRIDEDSGAFACALLRCSYICDLHRQALHSPELGSH